MMIITSAYGEEGLRARAEDFLVSLCSEGAEVPGKQREGLKEAIRDAVRLVPGISALPPLLYTQHLIHF